MPSDSLDPELNLFKRSEMAHGSDVPPVTERLIIVMSSDDLAGFVIRLSSFRYSVILWIS